MTTRQTVSIITGTIPSRFDLLAEAMANIRSQTYANNVEHCIAVEGENRAVVHETVARIKQEAERLGCADSTHVVGLGRWWSRYLAASMSTVPFRVAQDMSAGEYLMWAADDERFEPDHIESLVTLLEETDSDFVYGYVRLVPGPGVPLAPHVIGSDPPMLGQITNALFRADLLDYRGFTTHVGSATDWDQVSHWLAAGARWAMLDRVTLTHRIDKLGEGPDFRSERRPLRGHRERVEA